jgi:flagellar biosynthetic protein FlhB
MPEQFGDKQHEATPYRRQKAREEGQVPRSHDLASAALLLSALGLLLYFGQGVVLLLVNLTQRQLGSAAWRTLDRDRLVEEMHSLITLLGSQMLPVLGLLVVAAVAIQLSQTGVLFLPEKLGLDLSRISPLRGFQRIFSLSNAIRLGFGLLKIVLVATVAYWCLWAERHQILGLCDQSVPEIARYVVESALWTCLKIGAALLILALFDYGYQWWKHEQDLRMTTQELREELKTLQGDPHIAARRKSVQRQLVMQRINTAVPKAQVVVTNPTELAVALQYDMETMSAPIVVAKGAGAVALRIRRLALEHNIPVVERKELARALFKHVDIGRPIPPEQYAAMAEVLRYVYELKGETPNLRSRQRAA